MPGEIHFWAGLLGVKDTFLRLGLFKIGDGTQVRFWEDKWRGNATFKELFPGLYDIVRKKESFCCLCFKIKYNKCGLSSILGG